MSTMMVMLCVALGLMALALLSVTLVAIWVYRDAKSRGLEAWVWTLVTVLVPSFIGLLLYFLVGRKDARTTCPACARPVPVRSAYCGNCGERMPEEPPRPDKRGGKGLLISGLVCLGLTIVLGFGAIIGLVIADGGFENADFFSVSTVYVENHGSDFWSVRFHYTNKTPRNSFLIGSDGPYVLDYEGKCGEGPLTLRVRQGDLQRTVDLSGGETVTGTLDLSGFRAGERIELELDHNGDEGRRVEFKCGWKPGSVQAAAPAAAPEETAAFLADAERLIEAVEATHPAFVLDAVPAGYEEAKAALLETAQVPGCTTAGFAWAALAYTTSLHDGHTTVDVFGGTPQAGLDLDWYADGDRLCLTDGGEVTAIGGVAVKTLFEGIDRCFPAENQAGRDRNHGRWAGSLPVLALLGADLGEDYASARVSLTDGTEKTAAFVYPKPGAAEPVISTELLDDVFYVDFNRCVPGEELDAACEALRRAVKDGVRKVVIDVRGNGGGDSSTCERLLEAMNMAAPSYGGYVRYSPLAREQRGYDKAEGGERGGPNLSRAKQNPDVKLVVLSDEDTFSSATMLCVFVRDGKLGTIVGRTSANAPNSYGDVLSFHLLNTGMKVTVSYKQWLRPDEKADPDTVTPDIVTAPGEDALAAALSYLKR